MSFGRSFDHAANSYGQAKFVGSDNSAAQHAACCLLRKYGPDNAMHQPAIDPVRNELLVTGDGRILWNGVSVNDQELITLLDATAIQEPEPELSFRPEADANYHLSAKVLQRIKESGVTNLGFVGNEAYSSSDVPSE